jgi:hypothetical protein
MPPETQPAALGAVLRRAVLDHLTSEHRRVFPPSVHVGTPGVPGASVSLSPADRQLDHALRVDALQAMVRCVRRQHDVTTPLVWLTRRGTLEVQDVDLAWTSAARTASAELDLPEPLPLVVVTRQGWHDPRTGATRTWRRLRPPR